MAKKYYKIEFEDFGWENILKFLEGYRLYLWREFKRRGEKDESIKSKMQLVERYWHDIEERLLAQGFSRTEHLT